MWNELTSWQKKLVIALGLFLAIGTISSICSGLFVVSKDEPVHFIVGPYIAIFCRAFGSSDLAAWMQAVGVIIAVVASTGIAYKKNQQEKQEKIELAIKLLKSTRDELFQYKEGLAITYDFMKSKISQISLPPEENRFLATNLLLFRPELPVGEIMWLLHQFNQSIRRVTDVSTRHNFYLNHSDNRVKEFADDKHFELCKSVIKTCLFNLDIIIEKIDKFPAKTE